MNISAHEVSELLFHPANFDNDDGIETNGGLPDIKQVSFDFIHIPCPVISGEMNGKALIMTNQVLAWVPALGAWHPRNFRTSRLAPAGFEA